MDKIIGANLLCSHCVDGKIMIAKGSVVVRIYCSDCNYEVEF